MENIHYIENTNIECLLLKFNLLTMFFMYTLEKIKFTNIDKGQQFAQ